MAVRCSALSLGAHGDHYSYLDSGDWQANLAYRWLHSDRHFIGDHEQGHRQRQGSEVINDVHTFDITATYAITPRLNASLTLPLVYAERSSLYEHDRTNRHTMSSRGLGDMRLVANYWVLDPKEATEGNFSVGIGFKAPTGNYKNTDFKYRATGPVLDYVDNSIQPGDGGWGIMLEIQGFQKLWERTFFYGSATYLATPETQNSIGNSIWDAYVARAGLQYAIWPSQGLALSLGGRIEGVPPDDIIGHTAGRRRPGYAASIEPGVHWAYKAVSMNVTVPVALYRVRQNYLGREGDAAFADFIVLSSITFRF